MPANVETIGGSDASVVCGISRYKSPVELWMEKTGQLPTQEAGEAAYWGTQLEALVRAEFTKRTGIPIKVASQLLQSEEHAAADGEAEENTGDLFWLQSPDFVFNRC